MFWRSLGGGRGDQRLLLVLRGLARRTGAGERHQRHLMPVHVIVAAGDAKHRETEAARRVGELGPALVALWFGEPG
ncbi:MAG TPA: hypothetical protein VIC28_17680, partial [Thermoanaerobaculia bacterium]